MSFRARPFLTVTVILALLLAAGCGGSDDSSPGTTEAGASASPKTIYVFAYFPHSLGTGTWAWYNGWRKAAEELKPQVNVVIKEMGKIELEPANYLNFIRTGLITKPDGVVVVPNSGASLAAGLKQMQAQNPGIKWLAMDQPIPGLDVVSYVGTDNRDAGRKGAEYLIEQHADGKLKSDEVVVFKTVPGATSQDDRAAGFMDAIKGSPLKVVQTIQEEDSSRAKGRANMIDVLTRHPDVGGVFSTWDAFAIPVASALMASDRLDVVNVAVDGSEEGTKALIAGKGIDVEIAQHYYDMGYQAVTMLARALEGESVPKSVDTGSTLVTKSNAEKYLAKALAEGKPAEGR